MMTYRMVLNCRGFACETRRNDHLRASQAKPIQVGHVSIACSRTVATVRSNPYFYNLPFSGRFPFESIVSNVQF